MATTVNGEAVANRVREAIERAVAENGGSTTPVRPSHRVPFHWPPHGISYDFHVSPDAWAESEKVRAYDDDLVVEIATTENGVFARVVSVWSEARAETREEAVRQAVEAAKPYYDRVEAITKTLGLPERFRSTITDLPPDDLVALLYCPDRDVAYKALTTIERQASLGVFGPALLEILNDHRHPHRRSAQWCVLDMLEDVTAFFKSDEERKQAVDAIKELIWLSTNDYARTVFKAGVVLGGHISDEYSADALIECLGAPSKFGRRSAIHAVFHLCEWLPEQCERASAALREMAVTEPEPALAEFARYMADDIERHATDHMAEPFFEDES